MNFKRFYINGNRFSFYIIYRSKIHRFEFENTWNTIMYRFTMFTTQRYVIVEEHGYFSIYYKYYFSNRLVEKWVNKEDAKKRVTELYKDINSY